MKKSYFYIVFYIFTVCIAQENPLSIQNTSIELYCGSVAQQVGTTTFILESIGTVWLSNSLSINDDYNLLATYISNTVGPRPYATTTNEDISNWSGFDWDGNFSDAFGYGLFKLSVDRGMGTENPHFYIDYRDDFCGFYPAYETNGHPIDIWIKYDETNDNFYLKITYHKLSHGYILMKALP